MSKVTCDVCKDLIPLVLDGVASKDSEELVNEHIDECEECKEYFSLYNENDINNKECDSINIFNILRKKLKNLLIMLVVFGVLFGLGLTAKDNMLYNCIIMPLIGVIGYGICRWKAVYIVPSFMILCYMAIMVIQLIEGIEYIELVSFLIWIGIYSIFVIVGVVIVGLLHYSFRKE